MYDLFNSAKQNNLPGIILLLVFEKAFDSISFEFIMTTMDLFDFGENFKEWIRILLGTEVGTNFNVVTVVNGNISKPISIRNGYRNTCLDAQKVQN